VTTQRVQKNGLLTASYIVAAKLIGPNAGKLKFIAGFSREEDGVALCVQEQNDPANIERGLTFVVLTAAEFYKARPDMVASRDEQTESYLLQDRRAREGLL
jgi:hypothetical protein